MPLMHKQAPQPESGLRGFWNRYEPIKSNHTG